MKLVFTAFTGYTSYPSLDDKQMIYSTRVTLEFNFKQKHVDQRDSIRTTTRQVQHCQAGNEGQLLPLISGPASVLDRCQGTYKAWFCMN